MTSSAHYPPVIAARPPWPDVVEYVQAIPAGNVTTTRFTFLNLTRFREEIVRVEISLPKPKTGEEPTAGELYFRVVRHSRNVGSGILDNRETDKVVVYTPASFAAVQEFEPVFFSDSITGLDGLVFYGTFDKPLSQMQIVLREIASPVTIRAER